MSQQKKFLQTSGNENYAQLFDEALKKIQKKPKAGENAINITQLFKDVINNKIIDFKSNYATMDPMCYKTWEQMSIKERVEALFPAESNE